VADDGGGSRVAEAAGTCVRFSLVDGVRGYGGRPSGASGSQVGSVRNGSPGGSLSPRRTSGRDRLSRGRARSRDRAASSRTRRPQLQPIQVPLPRTDGRSGIHRHVESRAIVPRHLGRRRRAAPRHGVQGSRVGAGGGRQELPALLQVPGLPRGDRAGVEPGSSGRRDPPEEPPRPAWGPCVRYPFRDRTASCVSVPVAGRRLSSRREPPRPHRSREAFSDSGPDVPAPSPDALGSIGGPRTS
jgi:hypothetical protein